MQRDSLGAMAAETERDLVVQRNPSAVLIQKTYRGYRVRRKLADAAIMSRKFGWCVPASYTSEFVHNGCF